MLKHVSNGYVGRKMLKSSLPKVKNDDKSAKHFEEEFGISRKTMRIVGMFELIGSLFLFMSVFSKKFVRVGTVMLNLILGVAIYKHFQAGHGFKGAKSALELFSLNVINFVDTLRKKNN